MIVITSKDEIKKSRVIEITRKMVAKNLCANDPVAIQLQEAEIEKLANHSNDDLLDTLERVIDKQ